MQYVLNYTIIRQREREEITKNEKTKRDHSYPHVWDYSIITLKIFERRWLIFPSEGSFVSLRARTATFALVSARGSQSQRSNHFRIYVPQSNSHFGGNRVTGRAREKSRLIFIREIVEHKSVIGRSKPRNYDARATCWCLERRNFIEYRRYKARGEDFARTLRDSVKRSG